jgi:L-alanine-DL-glutamate epimerase-like enolase superfamily enzyme
VLLYAQPMTRIARLTTGHVSDGPGGRAGKPISPQQLGTRLTRLGILARAGRTTALMDLAAQVPAVALSRLLGLKLATATAWTQTAGNTRPGYAAQVARRSLHGARPPGTAG